MGETASHARERILVSAKAKSVTVAVWAEGANAGAIFELAPIIGGVAEQ